MRIHEVARVVGVSRDTLVRWERAGRIPRAPRDVNRHRRYTAQDVTRLRNLIYPAADAQRATASTAPSPPARGHRTRGG